MSELVNVEKASAPVFSRVTAFLVLATGGIVVLFTLLLLASVLLQGVIWFLGPFSGLSLWVDVFVENITLAFLVTLLLLAVAFGIFLKAVLLRKIGVMRRLRDMAFGTTNSKSFSRRRENRRAESMKGENW